jgi:hypothetical protein
MSSSPSISYGDLFDTTSSISHANAQIDGSPPCDRWTGWSYFPESDMPLTPATPKRPSEANAVPKSTLRRRPMTEDRAYMEMLQCVEASATYDAMSVERLEGWNKERQNKLEVSTYTPTAPELPRPFRRVDWGRVPCGLLLLSPKLSSPSMLI